MDYAHLTYAVALLTMACSCVFLARSKSYARFRWWLPIAYAVVLMACELLRVLDCAAPSWFATGASQSCFALFAGLALWEFSRQLFRHSLPSWLGGWALALPVLAAAMAAALLDEAAFEKLVWTLTMLPAGLLAAAGLFHVWKLKIQAALLAIQSVCATLAGIAGGGEISGGANPLFVILAAASTFALAASLWKASLDEMDAATRKAPPQKFTAPALAAIIALALAVGLFVANRTGERASAGLDRELKEDAFFVAKGLSSDIANGLSQKELKKALDVMKSSHELASTLRLASLEPEGGKLAVVATSGAKAGREDFSKEGEAAVFKALEKEPGSLNAEKAVISELYKDADGKKWRSVVIPLKRDGRLFLEVQVDEKARKAEIGAATTGAMAATFMAAALALAFFMLNRMDFEARAILIASEMDKDLALWGSNAGLWKLDIPNGVLHAEPRCMEMLGYPWKATTWTFSEWKGLIHPDDLDDALRRFNAHLEGKTERFESEHRLKKLDGSWSWVIARGKTTGRDPKGRPTELSGANMDINAQKESELQLRRSMLRLEAAQKLAGLGAWELSLETMKLSWNEQTGEMLGLTRGTKPSLELFRSIVHPADLPAVQAARINCATTGKPVEMRCRIFRPDKSMRHLLSQGRLLRDANGKPLRIEGALMDITDFITAEEALQESEANFRSLVETMEDVVVRTGLDMKFLYISPALKKYVNFQPQDCIGKSMDEAGFEKSACDFWRACLKACIESGSPIEREFAYDTKIGRKLFNFRSFPELGADGKIKSLLSITRDVTMRREAEIAFRDIFNNMLEGFAMNEMIEGPGGAWTDFRFISVNPAFERLTGRRAQQLAGRPAKEAFPRLDEAWLANFSETLKTGASVQFESEISGVDKRFEIAAYKAGKGKFAFTLTDVTERHRAVDELHKQMRLMKELIDGIPDMLLLLKPDRSIVACNRAAKTCIGWEGDDMRGCKCSSLLGLSSRCNPCVCESAAKLCAPSVENINSAETGRSYEIRAIPIPSPDNGKAELIVELIRDTTEKSSMERDLDRIIDSLQAEILQRMNAEEALRRSERLHRMITEAAQVGIWQLELDGRIKYLNPRMKELLELEQESDPGRKTCFDFIPETKIKPVDTARDRQESFIHSYESEIVGLKGTRRNVLVSGIVVYAQGSKKLESYIETFTDITQIRNAERDEELRKIKLMQTEKMASLGILVSGVAHEINNPTNFIMLNAPILREVWNGSLEALDKHAKENEGFALAGLPYEEMRTLVPELFKSISDGAERIKNIVAGLKDYARQEIATPYATTNVNEAVQASLILLSNMIKKATRRFKVVYGKDIPEVNAQKQKIEQVVINLVQNSCQALKNMDCALTISTSFENGRVKIEVSDEGCGIPQENMPYITDPFFTTKRDAGGTGLGLSISAGIVNEVEGELSFKSEPGVGTTATVSLPPLDKNALKRLEEAKAQQTS